jgi:NAD(P)H-dependent FMN reductase
LQIRGPLLIVTYGGHGGTKCAAQSRQVADGLKMRALPNMPAIALSRGVIEGTAAINPATDFSAYTDNLEKALADLAAQWP